MKTIIQCGSLSAALFCAFMVSAVHAAENSSAFEQFAQLAQTAADRQGAKILVQYNADTRLLQVARELQVNPFRKLTQVQSVPVDKLADEAEITPLGSQSEPWLKIYCRDKKKSVQLNSTREINGVHDEELDKEERLAFLTLPCHPAELKKVQVAYAEFRKSVSR